MKATNPIVDSTHLGPVVITILRGSFSRTSEIDVPFGRVDLRPPKVIVGDQPDSARGGRCPVPRNVVTLPAVLDTGFNRTLEIDESHL